MYFSKCTFVAERKLSYYVTDSQTKMQQFSSQTKKNKQIILHYSSEITLNLYVFDSYVVVLNTKLNPQAFNLSKDKLYSQLGLSNASTPHIVLVARYKGQGSGQDRNMSESLSEATPVILVNSEQEEQQQESTAKVEEQLSVIGLEEAEDGGPAEKETRVKMQSVFQQVRNQIRSQVGLRAPKGSILEVMQRVKEREIRITQVNSGDGDGDGDGEEKEPVAMLTDESKEQADVKQEELRDVYEKRLETIQKALREDFEAQISGMRTEMRAYIHQALKDLECKMQSQQLDLQQHTSKLKEGKDRAQKPSAPPSLAARRGRVLTRTMTTIVPKTCAPVILGQRAKSEISNCSKGKSSRLVLRDPLLFLPGNKPCQCRRPLLPPAYPQGQQHIKSVPVRAKTGN